MMACGLTLQEQSHFNGKSKHGESAQTQVPLINGVSNQGLHIHYDPTEDRVSLHIHYRGQDGDRMGPHCFSDGR